MKAKNRLTAPWIKMMMQTVSFFVYGTLKTGQCREKYWPIRPLNVVSAWTFGKLYDLGPYPAMLLEREADIGGQSPDRVAGQLWSFESSEFAVIADVLDRIECTNQVGYPNEYDRVELPVTILKSGVPVKAQTYIYSNATQLIKSARRVQPIAFRDGQLYAAWPKDLNWFD